MKVAILTFDGFNELDTFIALGLINRLSHIGWSAVVTSPTAQVTSMNGVTVTAQQPLEFANEADIVLFGSGIHARTIAREGTLLDRLQLDPVRQLIGGQCSGTLLMARLGLLADTPACTDDMTKPWIVEAGVRVLEEPFHARGPIATAGGCLASQYLAAWAMVLHANPNATRNALHYATPMSEKDAYVERLLNVIKPFLPPA